MFTSADIRLYTLTHCISNRRKSQAEDCRGVASGAGEGRGNRPAESRCCTGTIVVQDDATRATDRKDWLLRVLT